MKIATTNNTNSSKETTEPRSDFDQPLDLLIVGAGPAGLTAAVEAQRLGLSYRIIERKSTRSTHDSRAMVVHPRVMELMEPAGRVTQDIEAASLPMERMNVYFGKGDGVSTRLPPTRKLPQDDPLHQVFKLGDTEFPFLSFLPQYATEKCLEDELLRSEKCKTGSGRVEYGTELRDLTQTEDKVVVSVMKQDKGLETIECSYVVGCDGGRSKTRDLVGVTMHRAKSKVYFVVAELAVVPPTLQDVGDLMASNQTHAFWYSGGVIIFFPLPELNRYRFIAQAPDGMTDQTLREELTKSFFESLINEGSQGALADFDIQVGSWATIFEITHGVSDSFRKGRVFLAGDAVHVHSPVGDQGMNYGMQDAHNLLWKLAWAKDCQKRETLEKGGHHSAVLQILDSYHDERHTLGKSLIREVEIATRAMFWRNPVWQYIRNNFIRYYGVPNMKHGFRYAGQLELKYAPQSSSIILKNESNRAPAIAATSTVAAGVAMAGAWITTRRATSASALVLGAAAGLVSLSAWGLASALTQRKRAYLCQPGSRLPNLVVAASANGGKLHQVVNRSTHHHTWIFVNQAIPEKAKKRATMCVSVTPAPVGQQCSVPFIPPRALQAAQVILVRPDLFVAAVDRSFESLWNRLEQSLEAPCLETL